MAKKKELRALNLCRRHFEAWKGIVLNRKRKLVSKRLCEVCARARQAAYNSKHS